MKRLTSLLGALVLAATSALAQTGGEPPDWTNNPPPLSTNLPPVWTNRPPAWTNRSSAWGANAWWTNALAYTNRPTVWTNRPPRVIPPNSKPNRVPPAPLPPDVQAVVQQFQQNRDQIMNQLKTATDDQRQQILNQLEQLRQQQRTLLLELRQQAADQARQMQGQFANSRDQIINAGVPSGASGHATSTSNVRGR